MQTKDVVFIVDDNADVRYSLECVLESADFTPASHASAESLLASPDLAAASCMILDLRLPGMSGEKLLETIRAAHVALPVIVISGHADIPSVINTMKLGVADFLIKPVEPAVLVQKVREAVAKGSSDKARLQEAADAKARIAKLSDREREVLQLLVRSKGHKQIAQELGVSIRTVDHHHARISQKMEVEGVADLTRCAVLADLP